MKRTREATQGPDRDAALRQYQQRARIYDLELALFEPYRRMAIDRLGLKRGQTVLDVGCGTGLSLDMLQHAVGGRGRVVGIEQSPAMLDQARARLEQGRWSNVGLVAAPVEDARIDTLADAALFHFTHDVLRRPEAVANVMTHLRPGARVVAAGLKWAPPWLLPANLFVLGAALRSVTSLDGLDEPWQELQRWLDAIDVESHLFGAIYLASGRCDAQATRPAAPGA